MVLGGQGKNEGETAVCEMERDFKTTFCTLFFIGTTEIETLHKTGTGQ